MKEIFRKMRVSRLWIAQVAVVSLLALTVTWQVGRIRSKIVEMADLKDPSPFTGTLVGHMNGIQMEMVSYLQHHDAQALDRMNAQAAGFRTALESFRNENKRLLSQDGAQTILKDFDTFIEMARTVTHVGGQQAERAGRILNDHDEIMNTFEYRLRPLVRGRRSLSTVRSDLITNMEIEVRGIPEAVTRLVLGHPAPGDEARSYERRFEKFLRVYEPLAQTAAERRDIRHIRALWNDMSELVVDVHALEESKRNTLQHFDNAAASLRATILTILPAVPPGVIAQKKDALLHAIYWLIAGALLLLTLGGAACAATFLLTYRRVNLALQEIRTVTDAATTGDLSREISLTDSRELGAVGRSVNQLIGVLRRSEQLILQLGTIVESSGDAWVGLTLEGTILSWNNSAARLYGYTFEEVKGKPVSFLFPFNRGQLFTDMQERLEKKKTVTEDGIHLRRSGVPMNVRMTLTRLLDPNGTPIGLSLLCRELALSESPKSPKSQAA